MMMACVGIVCSKREKVREEERMTVMMDTARVLFLRACFVIPYSYIFVTVLTLSAGVVLWRCS